MNTKKKTKLKKEAREMLTQKPSIDMLEKHNHLMIEKHKDLCEEKKNMINCNLPQNNRYHILHLFTFQTPILYNKTNNFIIFKFNF